MYICVYILLYCHQGTKIQYWTLYYKSFFSSLSNKMRPARAFFIVLFITSTIIHLVNSRFISHNSDHPSMSDGIIDENGEYTKLGLEENLIKATTTVTCEPIYGFLPCTTNFWGLLFMIVVYEVLLSFGERYVSTGSDLFFENFGTGIFGGSIFHLLGTFPQAGLILGKFTWLFFVTSYRYLLNLFFLFLFFFFVIGATISVMISSFYYFLYFSARLS